MKTIIGVDLPLTLVDGCTPVSEGCKNCWSAAMAHRYGPQRDGMPQLTTASGGWTGNIYLRPEALDKIPQRGKPRVYAVWTDLFHENVPDSFITTVWHAFTRNPKHTFIIITKRAQRAVEWAERHGVDALPNVWFVGTCENQGRLDERASEILKFPAVVRGLINEPMLGPVSYSWASWHGLSRKHNTHHLDGLRKFDWVIVGCETGANRRPCNIDWIRQVVDQCQNAQVSVWVKAVEVDGKIVSKLSELPGDLRVRELPNQRSE